MSRIFPRDSKDGDPVEPRLFNMIFAELERWRNVVCVPPLMIDDAEGESPPVFSVQPDQDDGAFFCVPSSTVGGATGTWPNLTAVSFTADVYQMTGGAYVKIVAGATNWNGFPASLAASKVCALVADGTGDWVVYSQSCT
jgi:hypothetical protein